MSTHRGCPPQRVQLEAELRALQDDDSAPLFRERMVWLTLHESARVARQRDDDRLPVIAELV